jgi:hypothetical protein
MPSSGTSIYEYGSFYYLPSLRLLIYTACRQGLILARLDTHLRIQHSLTKKERIPILEWAKATPEPGLIASEAELRATSFPRVLDPIRGLGTPRRDGLKYNLAPGDCYWAVRDRFYEKAGLWTTKFQPCPLSDEVVPKRHSLLIDQKTTEDLDKYNCEKVVVYQ